MATRRGRADGGGGERMEERPGAARPVGGASRPPSTCRLATWHRSAPVSSTKGPARAVADEKLVVAARPPAFFAHGSARRFSRLRVPGRLGPAVLTFLVSLCGRSRYH